jgi:hypothetical protein
MRRALTKIGIALFLVAPASFAVAGTASASPGCSGEAYIQQVGGSWVQAYGHEYCQTSSPRIGLAVRTRIYRCSWMIPTGCLSWDLKASWITNCPGAYVNSCSDGWRNYAYTTGNRYSVSALYYWEAALQGTAYSRELDV